jgi:hypothetical protein
MFKHDREIATRRRPAGLVDRRRLVGWSLLSVCLAAAVWAVVPAARRRGSAGPGTAGPDDPAVAAGLERAAESRLVVYPYSVIPGGAHNPSELRRAMARDPIVREHYADFDVARTRTVRLEHDEVAYVSYRWHNRVFWTSRPLKLPHGEVLLTDGAHYARTRCGNQVSKTPQQPTAPRIEPESSQMETPEQVTLGPTAGAIEILPLARREMPGQIAFPHPAGPLTPLEPNRGEVVTVLPPGGPLAFPPSPPARSGGPGGTVTIPPTGPPNRTHLPPETPPLTPPAPTPEPGTVLLLGSGVACVFVRRKKPAQAPEHRISRP